MLLAIVSDGGGERRRAPRHTMGVAHAADGEVRFELVALPPAEPRR